MDDALSSCNITASDSMCMEHVIVVTQEPSYAALQKQTVVARVIECVKIPQHDMPGMLPRQHHHTVMAAVLQQSSMIYAKTCVHMWGDDSQSHMHQL